MVRSRQILDHCQNEYTCRNNNGLHEMFPTSDPSLPLHKCVPLTIKSCLPHFIVTRDGAPLICACVYTCFCFFTTIRRSKGRGGGRRMGRRCQTTYFSFCQKFLKEGLVIRVVAQPVLTVLHRQIGYKQSNRAFMCTVTSGSPTSMWSHSMP